MNKARIRFSADILRRLGEELNPSLDKGIIELVKNAYDADATYCRIELSNTDIEGGSITIKDNGDGMTPAEIENGWLLLGRSTKDPSRVTRLERIPAGNKGLGRLAAIRMGSSVLLTTRPRQNKSAEFNLLIDWDKFDSATLVDDIELSIEEARRLKNAEDGTEIRIEGLHSSIRRIDVKRLARELILLADPFGDDPSGFTPELVAPEFEDIESLVKKRYFQDAEYHLSSTVDENGYATADVVDWKGKKLFTGNHREIAAQDRLYQCPAATFDLWVFILDKTTFSTRNTTLQEVRNWLAEFGGVHLYHNRLRVAPYGNPGNDWLDMNLRRVRSPEERPSTNTSIGRIDIIDHQSRLIQKTDRSGFIEDESYTDLVKFGQNAMDWMANRRLEAAELRRAKERTTAPKKSRKTEKIVKNAIADLPQSKRKPLEEAFQAYESSRDREIDGLRKEIQLYRTLSTAGITAATFAHESSGGPIKVIRLSSDAIERRGKENFGDRYKDILERPVNSIKNALEDLAVLGNATIQLLDHEKRRLVRVDLHVVIREVLKTFAPFLEGRGVSIDLHLCEGSPYLRGSEAAIESIITNILNNSLSAFESAGTMDRCIRITTTVEANIWRFIVLDNGPGIEGISKHDIWLPGQTSRKNGTGLGLTIVRDVVKDLNGDVDAIEHSDLGGAGIIIALPILGV